MKKEPKKVEDEPKFSENRADFKAFTEVREEPKREEPTNPAEPPHHDDKVEDISIASKRPVVDEEDIPPFLRKLRK